MTNFAQAASKLNLTAREASILALLARKPSVENVYVQALLNELRPPIKIVAEIVLDIIPSDYADVDVVDLALIYKKWIHERNLTI